jgi:polyvinyl alcohol dehydrogenase (cytochrome)
LPATTVTARAILILRRILLPWAGWGADLGNRRYQPALAAGFTRRQVGGLRLKWAFGFAGAAATYGQPTAFKGKVFVGSEDGTVYALDSATGCVWWTFRASATVKTAVSIGNQESTALFGDTDGIVYAVRVDDGSLVWKVSRRSTSCLPQHDRRCSQAHPQKHSGCAVLGPSGAAVWSTPTADLKRRALYITTGNNYSVPATATSDSVIAIDMDSGQKLWSRQFTPRDLRNSGCVAERKDNCPDQPGDDYDFGAPPILESLADGRDIRVLAQKSGVVYALDPARQGRLLWKIRIGRGGPLGGIEWSGAADHRYAYFPLSDFKFDNPRAGGGLFALDLRTGRQVWRADAATPACLGRFGCSAAQMAPPTAIPGVIFSGSLDGHLRAYDIRDGSVLWDFNTAQEFHTTNGIRALGGSLNGAGPAIVDGVLYVNTGYTNAMDGNVLLAFAPDPGK